MSQFVFVHKNWAKHWSLYFLNYGTENTYLRFQINVNISSQNMYISRFFKTSRHNNISSGTYTWNIFRVSWQYNDVSILAYGIIFLPLFRRKFLCFRPLQYHKHRPFMIGLLTGPPLRSQNTCLQYRKRVCYETISCNKNIESPCKLEETAMIREQSRKVLEQASAVCLFNYHVRYSKWWEPGHNKWRKYLLLITIDLSVLFDPDSCARCIELFVGSIEILLKFLVQIKCRINHRLLSSGGLFKDRNFPEIVCPSTVFI